jgi:hypothetical protein
LAGVGTPPASAIDTAAAAIADPLTVCFFIGHQTFLSGAALSKKPRPSELERGSCRAAPRAGGERVGQTAPMQGASDGRRLAGLAWMSTKGTRAERNGALTSPVQSMESLPALSQGVLVGKQGLRRQKHFAQVVGTNP